MTVPHPEVRPEPTRSTSGVMIATDVSPDAKEGISSFLEKRKPNFTGRPSTVMPAFFSWWEERDFR